MTDKQTYLFLMKEGKQVVSIVETVEPTVLRQLIDEKLNTVERLLVYIVQSENLDLDIVFDSSQKDAGKLNFPKIFRTLRDLFNVYPPLPQKYRLQKWLYEYVFKEEQTSTSLKWLESILSVQGYVLADPSKLAESKSFSQALNSPLLLKEKGDFQEDLLEESQKKLMLDEPVLASTEFLHYSKTVVLDVTELEQLKQFLSQEESQIGECKDICLSVFDTSFGCYGVQINIVNGSIDALLSKASDNLERWTVIDQLEKREEILGEYWFTNDQKEQPTLQFQVTVKSA